MLVMAIAAAIVAPSITRGTDALKVRTQVAGFAAMFRYAREQAITTRQTESVVVDPAARVARLVVGESTVRRTKAIPPGWTVDAMPPATLTVRFEPEGSSSGGDYRIAAGALVYRVTIDPITGRVRSLRE